MCLAHYLVFYPVFTTRASPACYPCPPFDWLNALACIISVSHYSGAPFFRHEFYFVSLCFSSVLCCYASDLFSPPPLFCHTACVRSHPLRDPDTQCPTPFATGRWTVAANPLHPHTTPFNIFVLLSEQCFLVFMSAHQSRHYGCACARFEHSTIIA